MVKNKSVFIKSYSRDNCLIIQDIWYKAFLEDVFGNNNPYIPPIIYYVEDGLVEIWEDKKAINYYIDKLLQKNKSDKNFFRNSMKEYRAILDNLKKYWEKKYLNSLNELEDFINLVEKGTKYFLIFYYSAYNEKTPKNIHKEAMKFRNVDAYCDKTDRIIKNTFVNIYPKTKGLTLVIKKDEIRSLPSTEELKNRKKNCVLIPGKTFEIINIEDFLKRNPRYLFKFEKPDSLYIKEGILRGQSGFSGLVKGEVLIIKRKEQIENMEKGKILVSSMTTPDFVFAMKKSVAIITDEGGVTCHAAIVSREMKKPCIIGTKIATKVLKDGDLVEVDANKGIVKILKKNS